MTDKNLEKFSSWFHLHENTLKKEYETFLRFPTISAEKERKDDLVKCAYWLSTHLEESGFFTELWDTGGAPVVYGELTKVAENRPTVLIYHHYDVQPVDPLNEWHNPPFEPTWDHNKVTARGASDNKGQCFYTLAALRALHELGTKLEVNLKILIEGEEEVGSEGLSSLLNKKGPQLAADVILIVDAGIPEANTPAITVGVRGIVTLHVALVGSTMDLHSGAYGGVAYNPNRALSELLTKLWDKDGRVAIPHFYDEVKHLTDSEKDLITWNKELNTEHGYPTVKAFAHQKEATFCEANWVLPTVEINGISGGYSGPGFKTVIPAKAIANLSCRLVPDQDPHKIGNLVAEFLKKNVAKGFAIEINLGHGGFAVRTSPESLFVKQIAKVYEEVLGNPCQYLMSGGSIPVAAELAKACKAELVFMGYDLPSDAIHAPNEHFDFDRTRKGFLTMARVLEQLK